MSYRLFFWERNKFLPIYSGGLKNKYPLNFVSPLIPKNWFLDKIWSSHLLFYLFLRFRTVWELLSETITRIISWQHYQIPAFQPSFPKNFLKNTYPGNFLIFLNIKNDKMQMFMIRKIVKWENK